LGQSIVPTQ